MHPRNLHRDRYPMLDLVKSYPSLEKYIKKNPAGELTINFDDQEAVRSLNAGLLKFYYTIVDWKIPANFLCPPIPGRADYIHYLADLFPQPRKLRGLDIGVGANAIYPLLGHKTYDWSFVGSDVNPEALASAKLNVEANGLGSVIELRLQKDQTKIFQGIVQDNETFDFTLCNPPFHTSAEEALAGSERKKRNLGLKKPSALNFGGQSQELWCEGGERKFIATMIEESKLFATQITWFTTLVSKEAHLPVLKRAIDASGCRTCKVIEMTQGQKKSRILAWSFKSSPTL